jgi:hypothetical protein
VTVQVLPSCRPHPLSLTSHVGNICRWLKFEEDVEDGGERWSKPYVATLSLHSLFELRSCLINGSVLLDMRASSIEEISGMGQTMGRGVGRKLGSMRAKHSGSHP